jgi:hypothetical protein
MLRVAAAVAKQSMDKQLPVEGLAYTAFSVHVLECQAVALGRIFKAAVTAEHPITGARDAAHITFFYGENVDAAPPAGPPVDAQGLPVYDENGEILDFPAFTDDADGYNALPPEAPAGGSADDKAPRGRRLDAAAGAAVSPTTVTVYDAVIVAGTAPALSSSAAGESASAPGTDAPPVTNPNALLDVFGFTLSGAWLPPPPPAQTHTHAHTHTRGAPFS